MRIEEDIKTTALQEAIHESEESGQCQRLLPNHTYSQLDSGGLNLNFSKLNLAPGHTIHCLIVYTADSIYSILLHISYCMPHIRDP